MNIRKIIFLFTFIFIFSSISVSQTDIKENYEKESLYLKRTFFGTKYIKNNKSYPVSIFNKSLENEMKISKDALKEYKKYKLNRNIVLGLNIVSLVLVGYGEYNYLKLASSNQWDDKLFNRATYSIYSGLGFTLISIPFQFKANNKLNKSIWLHNRDILNHVPRKRRNYK